MPALTQDRSLNFGVDTLYKDHPVEAAANLFVGAALSLDGGFAEPLDDAAPFLGFAATAANNTAGADGALTVKVAVRGVLKNVTVTGASAATAVGRDVYAPDSGTLTLVATDAALVGTVTAYHADGTCDMYFESTLMQAPALDAAPFIGLTPANISLASGSVTLDIEDVGKLLNVTAGSDTNVITLPATAIGLRYVVRAAVSGQRIAISPNASDLIAGPDFAGVDNKDRILTAATALAGDFVILEAAATGWVVAGQRGVWANEP